MVFTYGTGFYGKINTYNDQWIETKFFHIVFIPLIPLSSMYVTSSEYKRRGGINMELNSRSVLAAYARLFTFIAAAIALYVALAESYTISFLGLSIAFTCAILWVYFCFYYASAKEADFPLRDKVGSITGFYALPHYFDHSFLYLNLETFEKQYQQLYPGNNWKDDLTTGNIEPEKSRLLFAIALFNCMVNNTPEDDELYAKADGVYVLGA